MYSSQNNWLSGVANSQDPLAVTWKISKEHWLKFGLYNINILHLSHDIMNIALQQTASYVYQSKNMV